MRTRAIVVTLLLLLALAGCGGGEEPAPEAEATRIAAVVQTILTAEAREVPTATPAAVARTPGEIYRSLAPSVAYIESPLTQGSGVLIDGGYVLSNAHVVWPFDRVRIVFPDGREFQESAVVGWDLVTDLVLLGPLDGGPEPLPLVDGETLEIGEELFLIGYPGEEERFPQPALTRGILSRVREWERGGLSYFQADALIAGGQSGGILANGKGEVIGISGFSFTESNFGLVASTTDLLPRIEGLAAGEDVSALGDRTMPWGGFGVTEVLVTLDHFWDHHAFFLDVPVGSSYEIVVDSAGDVAIELVDMFGETVAEADVRLTGVERIEGVTEVDGPLFLFIEQFDDGPHEVTVTSSLPLISIDDPDDGGSIAVGESRLGNSDYPRDLDYVLIELAEGEVIAIELDAAAIDPLLIVDSPSGSDEGYAVDDDDGGGLFGLSSSLIYTATESGPHFIIAQDARGADVGGYYLTVERGGP